MLLAEIFTSLLILSVVASSGGLVSHKHYRLVTEQDDHHHHHGIGTEHHEKRDLLPNMFSPEMLLNPSMGSDGDLTDPVSGFLHKDHGDGIGGGGGFGTNFGTLHRHSKHFPIYVHTFKTRKSAWDTLMSSLPSVFLTMLTTPMFLTLLMHILRQILIVQSVLTQNMIVGQSAAAAAVSHHRFDEQSLSANLNRALKKFDD